MSLALALSFQTSNETCCHSCTCYGDPHCESFSGQDDTWVICDARAVQSDPTKCPLDRATCQAQLDHLGMPCVWQPNNANGAKWSIALQGSQCVFNPSSTPPTMLMYKADNFSIVLVMGERAIIQTIIVKDTNSNGSYVLDAVNCFTAAGTANTPWRQYPGQAVPPSNPAWLPYSFSWTPLDGGDILWTATDLPSKIDLSIRCTRTLDRSLGRVQYGPPRLNVEQLVEPLNWMTQRTNVGGFCPNGTIAKLGSTANTNNIATTGACVAPSDELTVAKVLCSSGTTRAGIPGCKYTWCKSVRADWQTCFQDIATYGWEKTFCATYTVPTKDASLCTGGNCVKCLSDIHDFGWYSAVNAWSNIQTSGDNCVNRTALPADLVDCQEGVRIQYEASTDNWVTYLAVPSTVTLCNGAVNFDSVGDAVMFQNRIRVSQCSMPNGCLQDKCQAEIGFSASFTFTAVKDESHTVLDLFEAGVLVCNPKDYSSPMACLATPVPAMCPCPSG
jgi:hypothetical protein